MKPGSISPAVMSLVLNTVIKITDCIHRLACYDLICVWTQTSDLHPRVVRILAWTHTTAVRLKSLINYTAIPLGQRTSVPTASRPLGAAADVCERRFDM